MAKLQILLTNDARSVLDGGECFLGGESESVGFDRFYLNHVGADRGVRF